jgi:hypothetical protein
VKVVVFDIDNCISDDRHRLKLIDWNELDPIKRYERYHAACHNDKVANKEEIEPFVRESDRVVFITGRPEKFRQMTSAWLHANGFTVFTLFMRDNGDARSSVHVKETVVRGLCNYKINISDIVAAFDDRPEILGMYSSFGIPARHLCVHNEDAYSPPEDAVVVSSLGAADRLEQMAKTFRERNAAYKDNYKVAGAILDLMFPDGMKDQEVGHLLSLVVVKLTRFTQSGMKHKDSVHDAGVYAAMIDSILTQRENNQGKETK